MSIRDKIYGKRDTDNLIEENEKLKIDADLMIYNIKAVQIHRNKIRIERDMARGERDDAESEVKTYETRLNYLESLLPKMLHFNQKQRVRKEAFEYAIKVMRGKMDNEIFN